MLVIYAATGSLLVENLELFTAEIRQHDSPEAGRTTASAGPRGSSGGQLDVSRSSEHGIGDERTRTVRPHRDWTGHAPRGPQTALPVDATARPSRDLGRERAPVGLPAALTSRGPANRARPTRSVGQRRNVLGSEISVEDRGGNREPRAGEPPLHAFVVVGSPSEPVNSAAQSSSPRVEASPRRARRASSR
jgi:hypothetical protein